MSPTYFRSDYESLTGESIDDARRRLDGDPVVASPPPPPAPPEAVTPDPVGDTPPPPPPAAMPEAEVPGTLGDPLPPTV